MTPAARSGYFVYVATSGDNQVLVLRLRAPSEQPEIIQKVDLTRHAAAGGVSTPMALSPDRRFLFVALRNPPLPIVSLAINRKDGRLTELGSGRLPASTPYVLVDRTGRFLFSVANPGATFAVNRISDEGFVADRAHQVLHIGHKLHCAARDEGGRFLYVSSTDDEEIFQFRFDSVTGRVEPNEPHAIKLANGGDPRHLVHAPDGRFLYVTTEAGGRVACFAVDRDSGQLSERAGAPMMAKSFSGSAEAADLRLTPDGRFLYASERALNRIVSYQVDAESGALTQIEETSSEAVPRALGVAPDGSFLLVAGEASGVLRAYEIDQASGKLTEGFGFSVGPGPNWVEMMVAD